MAVLLVLSLVSSVLVDYCTARREVPCPKQLMGEHKLFPFMDPNIEFIPGYNPNDLQVCGLLEHEMEHNQCTMEWTNWEHIRNKFNDRLLKGEKQFFRLRLPVFINGTVIDKTAPAIVHYVTVIWVTGQNQYMLHFPRNFQTLSLGTMTIISENLRNDHISWSCPSNCSVCGLGKKALTELFSNLTSSNSKYDWKYLCIPATTYGMEHILNDYPRSWSGLSLLNSNDFALPDLIYYWYFFKTFFELRPFLGIPSYKEDFPNYYCYSKDTEKEECVIKELLMKYYILVYTAIGLWCYIPLLVYYLPSSSRPQPTAPQGMIPAYKSPVRFTQCVRKVLCYYVREDEKGSWWKIRIRRGLVLASLLLASLRVLYFGIIGLVLTILAVIALFPSYLSKGINVEVPKCFPLFPNQPYPKGMIKWSPNKERTIEFQRLAYVMQERILLVFDLQFWYFIIANSFESFSECVNQRNGNFFKYSLVTFLSFLRAVCTLLLAVLVVIVYFLSPLLFFVKEFLLAIWRLDYGGWWFWHLLCGLSLTVLFGYSLVVLLVLSQLINDLAMFTYIGSVLTPTMALEYVTLLVAVTTTVVTMVMDLQKGYNDILSTLIDILKDETSFKELQTRLGRNPNIDIVKDNKDVHVQKKGSTIVHCSLLKYDSSSFTVSVHKELYKAVVEEYRPVRRQVGLVIIKILLTLYFIGIAMWIKNVFHIESKVSNIFTLASKVGIFFLPAALEFLAYKGQFGKKSDVLVKSEILDVVCDYLEFLV